MITQTITIEYKNNELFVKGESEEDSNVNEHEKGFHDLLVLFMKDFEDSIRTAYKEIERMKLPWYKRIFS